jgi:hypothetical protein
MSGFTKCPNGHYYNEGLANCPYCSSGNSAQVTSGDGKTKVIGGYSVSENPTIPYPNNETSKPVSVGNGTIIWEDTVKKDANTGEEKVIQQTRMARKLVGWLVSYSIDPMGAYFDLREGRNFIGRALDCSITISDGTVSDKHAILLFRADKYSLTDQQSTHCTFVNDEDIALEPRYLNDGDIIRVGQTVFRFRTSL